MPTPNSSAAFACRRRLPAVVALLLFLTACGEPTEPTVFALLAPRDTGVDFVNRTGENDSFNILTNEYIYNGGGVGVGDFDRDGRADLFFTGCDVPNRLYLNRGDWQFEDITETAGVGGGQRWNNGVTVVDVNGDGLDDVYVCATTREPGGLRANQLFINRGADENGIPTFTDEAPAMGIADTSHNTQAAWLDYDLDGDLDLFLLVNKMVDNRRPNVFKHKKMDGNGSRTDRLYRQDREGDHISFTEVGRESGILFEGFSLAVTVCDLNRDGAPDLYVSNDYLSNDLVYLNTVDENGRHYFRDIAAGLLKHTSYSAMGNDVVDLNNDGLSDIFAVDMLPEDNLRHKTMMTGNSYTYLINLKRYDYQPQFVRNTLQLSQGLRPDSLADLPVYSEVAMQAGIPATDWSWAPLVADFDLDGYKDIILTNGFPRDITDKDFIDYNGVNARFFSVKKILEKIPSVKLKNYAYRQRPGTSGVSDFEDVTDRWGITEPSFGTGGAYADLDGDGDLDYAVNNIDDPAHLFRNNLLNGEVADSTVRIRLPDDLRDAGAWGSEFTYGNGGQLQTVYHHPHRGYLSSQGKNLTFRWQPDATLTVRWQGGGTDTYGPFTTPGEVEIVPGISTGQAVAETRREPLMEQLSTPVFVQQEMDYVDFNVQPMLLRKLSQQGPGMAVTDFDGDGYDDLYVSGSLEQQGQWLRGGPEGFSPVESRFVVEPDPAPEELGCHFFDADGDGDEDLFVVSGSYELPLGQGNYRDRLYRNDGGRYTEVTDWVDGAFAFSGSCVRSADYDGDGDPDLFIGARVSPHQYPLPVGSQLLRNDGNFHFTPISEANDILASATNVCDAIFHDFTGDGRPDLLTVGEWSPPRLYANTPGGWQERTESAIPGGLYGMYNSLLAADLDLDGDLDIVAGNYGTNSILRASRQEPATALLTDLDKNGTMDFVPFRYFTNRAGNREAYPFHERNDFAKQTTKIKGLYGTHAAYAAAGAESYLPAEDMEAYHFRAEHTASLVLYNEGGTFRSEDLPARAQSFPVFGVVALTVNDDRYPDLLLIGNDYGGESSQGYLDAGNGLLLLGGPGGYRAVNAAESGFYVPGEGRALVLASTPDGPRVVASQNRGPLVIVAPRGSYQKSASTGAMLGGYLGQSSRTHWERTD